MKKAYIQPEAEILSLASLDDFLVGSPGGEIGGEIGDGDMGDNDDFDDDWT